MKSFVFLCTGMSLWYLDCASAFLPFICTITPCVGKNRHVDDTQLSMSIPNPLDTLTSGLASIALLPNGVTVSTDLKSNSETRLLQLYDVENSRECRSVRERVTELDLVVERVIPATSNSRAVTDSGFEYALPAGAEVPCLVASLPRGGETILSGTDDILSFFVRLLFPPLHHWNLATSPRSRHWVW
jgi:hypothetical protein